MNENIVRIQATIQAINSMARALEDIGQRLPQDPKLYAILAESPLEDLRRMQNELEQYLAEIRQVSMASAS